MFPYSGVSFVDTCLVSSATASQKSVTFAIAVQRTDAACQTIEFVLFYELEPIFNKPSETEVDLE
jgi:hypothetical protein